MHNLRRDTIVLDTPRENYLAFRDLFIEKLEKDDSFKAKYLMAEFESKLLDPQFADPPEARRAAAIKKWLTREVLNRDTNVRLMVCDETDHLFLNDRGFSVSIEDILAVASRFIRETIGELVPWSELRGSFSGGASTSLKRGLGTIARKYQEGADITEAAITPFLRLIALDVWVPKRFNAVEGNVMFTVPKTSVIDRVAAKEPEFNMYAQKAVGDFFRRRLKRVGIDLNDQTVNQRLAREGAAEKSLATIDLSSASDSITTQLVLRLLPEEWFDLLNSLRSHKTRIDGDWHINEMFSSMGNGFTFELESLIFWALVRACSYFTQIKGRISVYGDDIICPVGLRESVLATFDFCGFTVNTKKSFFEGDFRESCGKHWFNKVDVTPFYVKEVPVNVSDWILLLNSLRRWSEVVPGISDPDYFELWQLGASLVPAPLWGGWDLSSRFTLCAPGRYPIARLTRKQTRKTSEEKRLSYGAYLHWLDTSKVRTSPGELVTSIMSYDGPLTIRRENARQPREIPLFLQELRD